MRIIVVVLVAMISGCGAVGYKSIGFSLHNDTDKTLYNPWIKTNENKFVYRSSLDIMPFKLRSGGRLNVFDFKELPEYLVVGWKYGVNHQYIEKK